MKDRDKLMDVYRRLIVLTNLRHHMTEKFELVEAEENEKFEHYQAIIESRN